MKAADPVLVELLKESGVLVHSGTITHSYPFCWRTDTPLIYKAIPSWYINVEAIKDRMVALNESIHWVPDYVGTKRFGNWLGRCAGLRILTEPLLGNDDSDLGVRLVRDDHLHWIRRRTRDVEWRANRRSAQAHPGPRSRGPAQRATGPWSACRRCSTHGSTPVPCRTHKCTTRSRTRNGSNADSRRTSSLRASIRLEGGSTPC